jgi:hypothetical protein
MKSAIITQSNYIPWKGYFDAINSVDVFVVFDDVQYTKRDWRNRNLIKTPTGLKWLSIPVEVKGKFRQKINQTRIIDRDWQKSHLGAIRQNYQKAKCFEEVFPWIQELYLSCEHKFLTEINLHFIRRINSFLGISTSIRSSAEFNLDAHKTQRLVNICKELNVTNYFTGPAAKNYIDEAIFCSNEIDIHYWSYDGYPEYVQLYGSFENGATIFDLILNEGKNANKFLKSFK